MHYNSAKEAISKLYDIPEDKLIKLKKFGLENDGIYAYGDKIYKISSSKKEFDAANRLIGKNFNNVVKVYSCKSCRIMSEYERIWASYIIEEEKLSRNRKEFLYDSLDISMIADDIEKRVPFMVAIMNGIIELASLGIRHRDVHTLNIMFSKDGMPKIIDFGIVSLKKNYDQNIKLKAYIKNLD